MNNVIWKFKVPEGNSQFTFEMPKGAQVLTVQLQEEHLAAPIEPSGWLWAGCDAEAEKEDRYFLTVGTGIPLGGGLADCKYIGTYQQAGFVWHLFETPTP